MDSLLANYASSDEEEHEQSPLPPPPPKQMPLAKSGKSESKAVEERDEDFVPKSTVKRGGIFDSFPPPKPSLFNSLPPPKSQSFPNPRPQPKIDRPRGVDERDGKNVENPKPKPKPESGSSSIFSLLPPPKSSSSSSASKKVVQFKPPMVTNPHSGSLDDEDEDADEGEEERKRKRSKESISTTSALSFLSSIPAPRYSATLGALPSGSGTSRRSIVETDASASNVSAVNATGSDAFANPKMGYSKDESNDTNFGYSSWGSEGENHAYYSGNGTAPNVNVSSAPLSSINAGNDTGVNSDDARNLGHQSHEIYDHSSSLGGENYAYYGAYGTGSTDVSTDGSYGDMSSYAGSYEAGNYSYTQGQHIEYADYGGSYGDYGNNAQYENSWANTTAPEVSGMVENALPAPGKRGRKDVPPQIVEVNQDELMKNRPREDQVKLTGIAFGPAYQPTSTKGKPSKLHKRKHQIGSLYFDMKQKETELAERRAGGFLTKAQTQAKYGW